MIVASNLKEHPHHYQTMIRKLKNEKNNNQ